MSIQKTIGFSVLLHLVFFSAALLFSAGLLKGRENVSNPEVFYVKLAEDTSDEDRPEKTVQKSTQLVRTHKPARKQTHQEVQEKSTPEIAAVPAIKVEVMKENVIPAREEIADTNSHPVLQATAPMSPVMGEPDNADIKKDTIRSNATAAIDSPKPEGPAGLYPKIIAIIGRAIEKAKTYPVLARKRGIEGTVHVSFRISSSGRPERIRILKSSGHNILDKATINVVRKAAPYPHVDQRVEVPVAYKLRERG